MTAAFFDPWLKNITFRRSSRARRIRITVSSHDGIVVTIPPGVSHARACDFVKSEYDWIERQRSRLPPPAPLTPPPSIELKALGRVLTVQTTPESRDPARLHECDDILHLSGDWQSNKTWSLLLRQWLKEQALVILPHALAEQAKRMRLNPARLSIRLQRTRWGSCNRKGNISLNAKLLLLEPTLLNHVLIHELAHLLHLNHSPAFWAVVETADPLWRHHRQALRAASASLPRWLEH